jgi:exosortase
MNPLPSAASSPNDGYDDRTLLLYLIPSFIAMAWLSSRASWFWNHQEELSFGWIVLLLCIFLFWETWSQRPVAQLRISWISLSLGFLGMLLLFVFQIYQAALGLKPAALAGLALGVMMISVANLHFVFGRPGLGKCLFPYAFLLIAMPMPSIVQGVVVNGLQQEVAFVTVELLALLGVPADLSGSIIHLPSGPIGVDEACSGIRSLQSTLMATLFIGFLTLKGLVFRLSLCVAGILLSILGNLVRVFFLSYRAHMHGLEAVETGHDAAGWSILLFTLTGVSLLAWLLNQFQLTINRDSKADEEKA